MALVLVLFLMPNKSSMRPGFLFITCPDSLLLLEQIEFELSTFPASSGEYNRITYWGDEPPSSKFWTDLSVSSLLGEERVVIVRSAQQWTKDIWLALDKVLARPLASWLILCLEGSANKKGEVTIPVYINKLRCFAFATKKNWITRTSALTPRQMYTYIKKQAEARGLRLAPDALEHMSQTLPMQASAVAMELEKLSLLCTNKSEPIKAEFVSTASWTPEANIFSCIDALVQGNKQKVWQEYTRSTDPVGTALSLIGALALSFRKLWMSRAGEEVAFFGPLARRMPQIAHQIGFTGISAGIGQLMDAELAIKSGQADPNQVIERLLAVLLTLFSRAR